MRAISPIAGAGLAVLAVAVAPAAAPPHVPGAPGCPVFPADNAWNQRVDGRPVAHDSARLIATIGASTGLHPDFGTREGIPYVVVGRHTRRSKVRFQYASESDQVRYPIPAQPPIEGGSDHHILMVDRDACRLYELYAADHRGGRWYAGSGAVWDLRSNHLRPKGWTSADAAGLPILPGLARADEVKRGAIRHALRFTVPDTRSSFIFPARHHASASTSRALPPMGLRVRLRASFPVSRFPRQARIVLVALKRYGMILADNGSPWYITGAPSAAWNDDALHTLNQVHGSDLEVVAPSS
ncbi:MAG: hypothetical protein QOG68_2561 [Solirubrobacteraceae bacterium]|nr:hypothetical protein [Solirubrobacteraceae bacterium]